MIISLRSEKMRKKLKGSAILVILLIMLFSISIVSASNDLNDDLLTNDNLNDLSVSNIEIDDCNSNFINEINEEDSLSESNLDIAIAPLNDSNLKANVIQVIHTGDDAKDIQTAINTANNKDTVDLGSYSYNIGYSQLNIGKSITLRGDGESTVINGYGYEEGYGNSSSTSVLFVSAPDVSITGIRFSNIDPNLAYTDWDTLYGWALKANSMAGGLHVDNCSFINYNHGIKSDASATVVTNSYFTGTTTRLFSSSSSGGQERGTKCIHLYDASNCLIANNSFDGPVLDAILLEFSYKNTKILDNKFINNSYSIYFYGEPEDPNVIIANNTFTNCGHFEAPYFSEYSAIFTYIPIIDMHETYLSNILICQNTFNLRNESRIAVTPESDIYLLGNLTISQNVFKKLDSSVDESEIFLLDIQSGFPNQLSHLEKDISIINNQLIDGMYPCIFEDSSTFGTYEYWISFFGDLTISANAKATDLDLSASDIHAGEDNTISISLFDREGNGLNAHMNLLVINERGILHQYPVDIINGIGSRKLENLEKGIYYITAGFGGNRSYRPSIGFSNFTVRPKESILSINNTDSIISADTVRFDLKLTDKSSNGLNGTVMLNVKNSLSYNKTYTINIENGIGFKELEDLLEAGTYYISASFNGNEEFDLSFASSSIEVYPKSSRLNLMMPSSIISGESFVLNISLQDIDYNPISSVVYLQIRDENGNPIKIKNEYETEVQINEGSASIKIDELTDKGNYNITARYAGDSSTLSAERHKILEVLGKETFTAISIEKISFSSYNVSLELNSNGIPLSAPVNISINDNLFKVAIMENGRNSFILQINDLYDYNGPNYIISAIYDGDKFFASSKDSKRIYRADLNSIINVENTGNDLIDLQNAINSAGNGDIVYLKSRNFGDISNLNISKSLTIVSDDSSIYTKGDGKPIFNIIAKEDIEVNIRQISFVCKNNDIIVSVNRSDNSTKPLITLSNNAVIKESSKVDSASITLVSIDNKDIENCISLIDNKLLEGMKTIVAREDSSRSNETDNGNENGNGNNENNNPAIVKSATQLSYSNMKTTAVDTKVDGKIGKYFRVELRDSNNNPLAGKTVKIVLNKKTYNLKTDKNGIVKLQINLLKKGTYTVSISFGGDENYLASSGKAKITVKAQKPRLIVKAKTIFKKKAKVKKLTVKLLSLKKKALKSKKISLRIKGKTYIAKTNKKGIASFRIKLNKKGTYKCTFTFAGDKTYSKLTKTAKAIIK